MFFNVFRRPFEVFHHFCQSRGQEKPRPRLLHHLPPGDALGGLPGAATGAARALRHLPAAPAGGGLHQLHPARAAGLPAHPELRGLEESQAHAARGAVRSASAEAEGL